MNPRAATTCAEVMPVALTILTDVGVPSAGVTSVGDVPNTAAPEPVSSVNAAARFALVDVARNVETPVASPDTPVLIGKPVALVKVPDDGVPRAGVTSVGLVAKTFAPVPVSSVIAAARLALVGVARNAATPAAKPATPVLIGSPVAFVSVADVGVPKRGVTSVGDVFITNVVPVPVCDATAVALPVEVIGPVRFAFVVTFPAVSPDAVPVRFVATPEAGVPRAGVTSVGDVANTAAPVPVSSVRAAARLALVGVVKNVLTPVPNPETPVEIGKPVALVNVPDVGVPSTGVTNVGLVANTNAPDPVSSEITFLSCSDVVAAN